MDILDQAQALQRAGRPQEAVALIDTAARSGDPLAAFAIAHWRLYGLNGRRDLREAHRWLEQAVSRGHVDSTRLWASLIANGTGCRADPEQGISLLRSIESKDADAQRQLEMLAHMLTSFTGDRDIISQDPSIIRFRNFLSPVECQYLIEKGRPFLQPSLIIDPRTKQRRPNPIRTSSGMSFGPTQEDLVVNAINRRIASISGTRYDNGEPLHLLHYKPGEQYRPHLDTLPNTVNQRAWTLLLYLNDGYEGGETEFGALKIVVKGEKGEAVLFANVDRQGLPEARSSHAGVPIIWGEKWLSTRWIRQGPYHPWT